MSLILKSIPSRKSCIDEMLQAAVRCPELLPHIIFNNSNKKEKVKGGWKDYPYFLP